MASMLEGLPDDVVGLCEVAKQQTVHHNLLSYRGVSPANWPAMARVWPPYFADILAALRERPPHNLLDERPAEQRVIGACKLESHFLAGLLRAKGIPARVRAGYFQNIRANQEHIVRFWEQNLRAKRVNGDLLDRDPERWRQEVNAFSQRLNEIDHHIEHWVCEHWDAAAQAWRVLDANTTFLKAHSDLDVGFHLPQQYFESASAAWRSMRASRDFNPDRYVEEPQDGRSHIRAQLLWDFYSLLNHDIAGLGAGMQASYAFVKERRYDDTSRDELRELDRLADVLSGTPSIDDLMDLYCASETLQIPSAETDPYCFVHRG